jgi:mandelamide amidase
MEPRSNDMHSRRAFLQSSIPALVSVHRIEGQISSKPAPTISDALELGAAQVVAAIRSGQLAAESYASALLRRLEACANLNLTTWVAQEKLLEAARAVDRARSRGERLRPLSGLPILIKDNIDTTGFPTSAGTPSLEKYYPRCNAPVVQRLLDAGALVLAKTNMHELASGGTSSNAFFGPVRNPYAPANISGGSSGGTAAAIAARVGTVGLGTDTAGSVRIPSAFCGTVGLRPTFSGEPLANTQRSHTYGAAGVVPLAYDLDTIGPIGRTVDDVILLDEVITGRPVPRTSGVSGKRLGVSPDQWRNLDPEVEKVCRAALQQLKSAGAELIEVDLSAIHAEAMALFTTLITAGNQLDLKDFLAHRVPGLRMEDLIADIRSSDVHYYFEKAAHAKLSDVELTAARHGRRTELIAQYIRTLSTNRLDAIVCPTEPLVAPPIRPEGDRFDDTLSIGGQSVSAALTYIRNTAPTCVLGAPGLTVPAGLSGSGLPVALEFDALPGADAALLALGLAVQSIIGHLAAPPARKS